MTDDLLKKIDEKEKQLIESISTDVSNEISNLFQDEVGDKLEHFSESVAETQASISAISGLLEQISSNMQILNSYNLQEQFEAIRTIETEINSSLKGTNESADKLHEFTVQTFNKTKEQSLIINETRKALADLQQISTETSGYIDSEIKQKLDAVDIALGNSSTLISDIIISIKSLEETVLQISSYDFSKQSESLQLSQKNLEKTINQTTQSLESISNSTTETVSKIDNQNNMLSEAITKTTNVINDLCIASGALNESTLKINSIISSIYDANESLKQSLAVLKDTIDNSNFNQLNQAIQELKNSVLSLKTTVENPKPSKITIALMIISIIILILQGVSFCLNN